MFHFYRPLGCTAAAVLPKQDSGTSQIQVNPTQVREEMGHPVHRFSIAAGRMNTSVDEHLVPLDVLRGPFAKL